MNKRALQKNHTRELILTKAEQLFAARGFSAVKTLDIARSAAVSHGSVFSHFPTRESLIEVIIENFGRNIARRIEELTEEGQRLETVLANHLKCLSEKEDLYTVLISESFLLSESCVQAVVRIQSLISFHIFNAAGEEMKKGSIKGMEPHLLFNTWIGLIHHYILNRKQFAPEGRVLLRYGDELTDHFMNLLRV